MQSWHQQRPGRSSYNKTNNQVNYMSLFLIAFVLFLQKPPEYSLFSSALHADDHFDSENEASNQLIINQMMYRNHDHQQLLNTAEKFVDQKKYIDAVSILQIMFDSTEDSFNQKNYLSPPGSSRRKAHSFFEKLSPDLITTYEKLFGPSAEESFQLAKKINSTAAIREIVRRFFYTEAGFHATNWLGSRALDRGKYQLANQYFQNLLNSSVHQEKITKIIRLKSELCLSILDDQYESWQTAEGSSSKRVAYKVQPASLFKNSESKSHVKNALYELQSEMAFSGNNLSHSIATPPRLSPVWSHQYAHSGNVLLEKLLENWIEYQYEHSSPLSTVNRPVIAVDTIVYRDEKGLKAYGINNGNIKWNYRCQSSLYDSTLELHRKHGLSSGNLSRISSYFDLQHSYVGNSIQGSLTADQDRIYFIDGMDFLSAGLSPHSNSFSTDTESTSKKSRSSNCLVALDINSKDGNSIQPAWKLGDFQHNPKDKKSGPENSLSENNLLVGHYFLGAPAIGDGVLYFITEFKRQLNLVTVNSDHGKVLWLQGLGFVDKPIQVDRYRSSKACIPVISGGTILCPLSNGLLVAMDSTTEQLMWSYYCGDDSSIAEYGSWGHHQSTFGTKGFYSYPQVHGSNIIYLPRTSNYVHCIDLKSGKTKWKIPRSDAEYIGTVTRDQLLLVGKRYCKSINMKDGTVIWTQAPGMPSGRGVCIGSTYLIPLQSGRISAIDMMTGHEIGFSQQYQFKATDQFMEGEGVETVSHHEKFSGKNVSSHWTPGNLSIANGFVISCEPGAITAFPQAGLLLDETEKRLEDDSPSIQDLILAAELNLTLGQLQKARTLLAHTLNLNRTAYQTAQAEKLFRELLNLEISRGIETKRALYQLAALAKTPVQQGEYLMLRSRHELISPEIDKIIQTAHDLASLKLEQPLVLSASSRHLVSKESWIPHLIKEASGKFETDDHFRFHQQLNIHQQQALMNQDPDSLRKFITKYSGFDESEPVREKLAELLIRSGKYQEAEFLLIHNKSSSNKYIAAKASMLLVRLWNDLGLTEEAATLLHELENQYQDTKLDDSLYVRDFRRSFPEESLLQTAYRQQVPIDWQVNQVSIQETIWLENNRGLESAFDHSRGRFWSSNNRSFHILNKSYNNQGQMALINRMSGVQVGEIKVPYRHDLPTRTKNSRSGHYIPMGSPVSMMGISLLEYQTKEPLWKSAPKGDVRPHVLMRAGPAGERFSVFQSHHTLVVVNPVNGKILWQRNDLEANSGLICDQYSGLIGDEKVLVLFGSDRHAYTVYDTLTGMILYQGKLPKNENHLRNSFGRKFFYVAKYDNHRRVRIWDPLHDELLMDERINSQIFSSVTPDHKLVLGTSPSRVRVLDIEEGKTCLDVELDKDAFLNLNHIRGFYDSGDYYLNLQRSSSNSSSRKFSYYASNSYLPVVSIQGELIAINAKTGTMKWKVELPQRSVIHLPHYHLPFLMTISRVRDPWNSSRQSMLVEIIDRKNGQTIGLKDNIFPDRILHLSYFPENGLIELFGQNTKIDLDFSRKLQKQASLFSSSIY